MSATTFWSWMVFWILSPVWVLVVYVIVDWVVERVQQWRYGRYLDRVVAEYITERAPGQDRKANEMRVCSADKCNRPGGRRVTTDRPLCEMHYQRWRRDRPVTSAPYPSAAVREALAAAYEQDAPFLGWPGPNE